MALTDRGLHMIVIVSVLVGLATIAVGLRILARLRLRLNVGIDDHLCVVALVCLYGMLIELILCKLLCLYPSFRGHVLTHLGCTIGGNGSHADALSNEELLNFGKVCMP